MDAPLQSSDARAELARLRRRAYGPDADIAGDPLAAARLAELESAVKVEPDAADATSAVRIDDASDAGIGRVADVSTPTGVAGYPTGTASPAKRRRLRLVLVIILAALVGAGAAGGAAALMRPAPDVTLRAASVDPESDPATAYGWPASFLIARGELRAFEEYRGYRPWAGTASDGLICLFVTHSDFGLLEWSCTPPSINPIADAQLGNGTVSLGGGARNLVRFELRGDEVHVFDRPVSVEESP